MSAEQLMEIGIVIIIAVSFAFVMDRFNQIQLTLAQIQETLKKEKE